METLNIIVEYRVLFLVAFLLILIAIFGILCVEIYKKATEVVADAKKNITKEELLESAKKYGKSPYGQHLYRVAEDAVRY